MASWNIFEFDSLPIRGDYFKKVLLKLGWMHAV